MLNAPLTLDWSLLTTQVSWTEQCSGRMILGRSHPGISAELHLNSEFYSITKTSQWANFISSVFQVPLYCCDQSDGLPTSECVWSFWKNKWTFLETIVFSINTYPFDPKIINKQDTQTSAKVRGVAFRSNGPRIWSLNDLLEDPSVMKIMHS